METLHIIGGGLAGSEAAWQAALGKAPVAAPVVQRVERRGTEVAVVAARDAALLSPTLATVWAKGKVTRRP